MQRMAKFHLLPHFACAQLFRIGGRSSNISVPVR